MIGINHVLGGKEPPDAVVDGICACLQRIRAKTPEARTTCLPRRCAEFHRPFERLLRHAFPSAASAWSDDPSPAPDFGCHSAKKPMIFCQKPHSQTGKICACMDAAARHLPQTPFP